jgi:uncharacterized protein with PQ loop repeat
MNLGFLHLHARKRLGKHLEPFPSRRGYKRVLDRTMFIAALIAPVALIPQIFQIYTTHNVSGLAITTWVWLACMNILWMLYGLSHRTVPIVMTNFCFFFLNSAGVIGILLYR